MKFLNSIDHITNIIVNYLKIKRYLNDKKEKEEKELEIKTDKYLNEEIDNSNDTRISDAIRKEKQKQINNLKYNTLILIVVSMLSGCSLFTSTKTQLLNQYDINSLKSTDKTYRITEPQNISVYEDGIQTNLWFHRDWFIVHKDLLKDYNENQNIILNNQSKKNFDSIHYYTIILAVICILLIIYIKKRS